MHFGYELITAYPIGVEIIRKTRGFVGFRLFRNFLLAKPSEYAKIKANYELRITSYELNWKGRGIRIAEFGIKEQIRNPQSPPIFRIAHYKLRIVQSFTDDFVLRLN